MVRRWLLIISLLGLMVSLQAAEAPRAGFTAADVTSGGDVILKWKVIKLLFDTRNVGIYHAVENGSYEKIASGLDLTEVTYTHVGGATDNLTHRYFLVAIGPYADTIVSDTVSTIISTATSIDDARVRVTWNSAMVRTGYVWNGYYQVYSVDLNGNKVFIDSTSMLAYEWTTDHCIEGMKMEIRWSTLGDTSNSVSSGPLTDLYEPIAPKMDSVSVQDNGYNILGWERSLASDVGGYLILAYREGVWDTLTVIHDPDSLSYIDSTANSTLGSWTYAVSALDWCGNASGDLGIRGKLSTIFLEKPIYIKCEDKLSIRWSGYTNSADSLVGYQILLKDGVSGWYVADTVPPDSLHYQVSGLNDRQLYHIKVRAIGYKGGFSSTSNERNVYVVKPVRPSYVLIRSASVLENQFVQLFIEADTTVNVTGYQIWRSHSGEPEELVGEIGDPGRVHFYWTDSLARPANRVYSYRVTSLDSCGNAGTWSQSFETVKLELVNQTIGSLQWNEPMGFDVIQYDVLRGTEGNWQLLGTTYSGEYIDTEMVDLAVDNNLLYRIQVIGHPIDSIELTDTAYSSILRIIPKYRIWVPTAFHPGGGFNDQFKPRVWGVKPNSFTMHIYSRFGQLIWSTSDLETGWDGTVDGREAPNGIYTWVIRLTTNKGRIEDQAGNVVLIRTE